MIRISAIFLLSGLIHHTSSIQCFTCRELNYNCPLPISFDGGDESNENDIESYSYDAGYACISDHSINPETGQEKVILRGIKHCEEIDIPNRRVHCCRTNYCNKQLLPMTIRLSVHRMEAKTDIESNCQCYLPSILLISFAIFFQSFY